MSKRPNTHLIAKLAASGLDLDDLKTHIILRDTREQYLLGVTQGSLRAWDLQSGYEYTVTGAPEGYLLTSGATAREAFKFMTLGDDTYILNTTAAVQMDYTKRDSTGGSTTPTTQRWRISVNSGAPNYPSKADIGGTTYGKGELIDGEVSGTVVIGGQSIAYNLHYQSNVQEHIYALLKAQGHNVWKSGAYIMLEVSYGTPVSVVDASRYTVKYQRTIKERYDKSTWSYVTIYAEKAYTKKAVYASRYGVTAPPSTPETPQAYVWIRQADYAVTYTVKLNNKTVKIETPDATSDGARAGLNTEKLTNDLANAINGATATHGCVAKVMKGVIQIYHETKIDFDIEVTDGLYNSALKLAKGSVQTANDLPPYAAKSVVLSVRGDTDSDDKPYYVSFNQDSNVWEETTKYGIVNHFDADTMPHVLRRFQSAEYENENNPYGIYFAIEPVEWTPRSVGDESTVPVPSFVSEQDSNGRITAPRYITCMSFYRGRLWMLGGDYATASVSNDRHTFWQSTALLLSDDDPIDGYVDLTEHAEYIHNAVATHEGLLVFTRRGQYMISSQGLMSPMTFEFKEASSYASDPFVEPQPVGDRVSFITQRSDYAALQESFASDSTVSRKAVDVTSHVPEYVNGRVHSILATSTVNTQYLVMRDHMNNAVDTMYVYDFLISGNERVQSSWSKWTLSGQVIDGALTEDKLYLVMRHQDATDDGEGSYTIGESYYTIEVIHLVNDRIENELGFPVFLDSLQVTDDEPTDLVAGEVRKRFQGKWYRGFPYVQRYVFSPFYLRPQGKSTGETGGRLQLRRLTLNFDKTTSFRVVVETLGRETREVFFQGRVLGDIRNLIGKIPVIDGKRSFPLLGASGSITVSIDNDSLFDARFQSAYWEGFYNNRARRF